MSPKAEAKSKRGALIDRVNRLLNSDNPSEFEILSCKKEAAKLKEVEPAAAYSILGMVAVLENDIESAHRFHENALALSDDFLFLSHYAVTLLNFGKAEDAFPIAKKCYEKAPDYLDNLNVLIVASADRNRQEDFLFFCKKWKALTGKDHKIALFPEDRVDYLEEKLLEFDSFIKNCPSLLVSPDPEIVSLAEDLIAGVEID